MGRNVFFSQEVKSEQNLYEDLIIESLKIYGQDVYYLPREIIARDNILGEDKASKFDDAYMIEAYLEDVEGFGGSGDVFQKFGIEIRDECNFVVAKRVWDQSIGSIEGMKKPNEGDILYLPLSNSYFEITYVDTKKPFFQLSNLPTYTFSCALYEFNDEEIDTGVAEIDDEVTALQYTIQLTLGDGTGDYTINEEIYQGATLADFTAKAIVSDWNPASKILTIKTINGNFNTGGTVNGDTSGASYVLGVKETMVMPETSADNDAFKADADSIIDFTEDNPFSEEY